MEDLRDVPIQIIVSADKKTVWINNHDRCVLRAQNIPELNIENK